MTISKETSEVIKGVAIIMMLVHHFWNPILSPDLNFWYFQGNLNIFAISSDFSKICVAVFAFLNGYVMFLNRDKYKNTKYICQKGIRFLVDYWIIAILFIIIGFAVDENFPSLQVFVMNMFGFEVGAKEVLGYDYINVTFAWYVRFYVMLLITMPVLLRFMDLIDKTKYRIFVGFTVCVVSSILSKTLCHSSAYIVTKLFAVYLEWLPCVIAGYITCKYQLFDYLKNKNKFMIIAFMFLLFLIQYKIGVFINYTFIYPYLIIYIIMVLVESHKLLLLKRTLCYLGQLSMYIWFIHGIFFTPVRFFNPILYYYNNPVWVLISGSILAIIFSLIVKYIVSKTTRLLYI